MGQHFVPQYLLKGFTVDGAIWAHDRQLRKSFPTQPKSIANESDIYPDDLETSFNEMIEQPAQKAIDAVRSLRPITQEQMVHLAYYIITLYKRVPAARSRVSSMMPSIAEEERRKIREGIDALVTKEPDLQVRGEQRKAQVDKILDEYSRNPPPEIWQKSLFSGTDSKVIEAFVTMQWRYLHSKSGEFISCDNPVFLGRTGLNKPHAELTVALSRNVALWANRSEQPDRLVIEASNHAVKELNRRAAHNAERFLYSATDEPWILPFHCKQSWRLTRLF